MSFAIHLISSSQLFNVDNLAKKTPEKQKKKKKEKQPETNEKTEGKWVNNSWGILIITHYICFKHYIKCIYLLL